ncbi:MAG: hypothetical protein J6U14_01640 [Bacteroidaceae bacterium]|nr:hypothetical protein [Bacteroidaceae bacterium]
MKKQIWVWVAICLTMAFSSTNVMAQKRGANMRMEIVEVDEDDNDFSVFTYPDENGSKCFYMSMGREYKISELILDSPEGSAVLSGLRETCLVLGETFDEAYDKLDEILKLYDEEVGTVVEFPCRLSTGSEVLGEPSTAYCMVTKKTLGGKRLSFTFRSGNRQAQANLSKSVVKELRMGMKFDKKLHKNRY